MDLFYKKLFSVSSFVHFCKQALSQKFDRVVNTSLFIDPVYKQLFKVKKKGNYYRNQQKNVKISDDFRGNIELNSSRSNPDKEKKLP